MAWTTMDDRGRHKSVQKMWQMQKVLRMQKVLGTWLDVGNTKELGRQRKTDGD